MADLEQLKQKYVPVIETIQRFGDYGATLDSVDLDGEKLHLKGTAPPRSSQTASGTTSKISR